MVFDLDDTLTHVSEHTQDADAFIPVKTNSGENKILGVHYRPFLKDSLTKLKQAGCELVVWATGQAEYNNKIVNTIDPDNALFDARLFNEHCYVSPRGLYIKDLRMVSRDLENTIIVDDHAYSFGFQVDNGVLILPFKGESTDTELLTLTEYILNLMRLPDFRPANRRHFKYEAFEKELNIDNLKKKILK